MIKSVQMSWRLGPGQDWLASVTGVRPGPLVKSISNLQLEFVKATVETWTVPAVYNLPTNTYYRGRRNGEKVYFFINPEGHGERLTEEAFIDRVYRHFGSSATNHSESVPYVPFPQRFYGEDVYKAWLEPVEWQTSPKGSYWRDVRTRKWRVVIHWQDGLWIGSMFGKDIEAYHGPGRELSDVAKADVWLHILHAAECDTDLPVCTGCAGQEFEDGGDGGDDPECVNGCNSPIFREFPQCDHCGDITFTGKPVCDVCAF